MSHEPCFSIRKLVFFWLPILIAIGISFEYWYLAHKRETLSAKDAFHTSAVQTALSVKLAWRVTSIQPQFVASNLFSSIHEPPISCDNTTEYTSSLPVTAHEFEKFAASNSYWNIDKTITEVQWAPYVHASNREIVQTMLRTNNPGFDIFEFGPGGSKQTIQMSDPGPFAPIAYCSPQNTFIEGLDLYNDLFEGPVVRNTERTGNTLSTAPFELRGQPVDRWNGFHMGFTVYIPLFGSAGGVTPQKTANFLGVVANVVAFYPLLNNALKDVTLDEIDVFLFTVPDAISGETERFLAQFQSMPYDGMDNITVEELSKMKTGDITGDIVSDIDDPLFLIDLGDRTLRLVVRARSGRYTSKFQTAFPFILITIAIMVKLADKTFALVDHWLYKATDERRVLTEYHTHEELQLIDIDKRRMEMEGKYSAHNIFNWNPSAPSQPDTSNITVVTTSLAIETNNFVPYTEGLALDL